MRSRPLWPSASATAGDRSRMPRQSPGSFLWIFTPHWPVGRMAPNGPRSSTSQTANRPVRGFSRMQRRAAGQRAVRADELARLDVLVRARQVLAGQMVAGIAEARGEPAIVVHRGQAEEGGDEQAGGGSTAASRRHLRRLVIERGTEGGDARRRRPAAAADGGGAGVDQRAGVTRELLRRLGATGRSRTCPTTWLAAWPRPEGRSARAGARPPAACARLRPRSWRRRRRAGWLRARASSCQWARHGAFPVRWHPASAPSTRSAAAPARRRGRPRSRPATPRDETGSRGGSRRRRRRRARPPPRRTPRAAV